MNETDKESDALERLLKKASVGEPSRPLKERVTAAAREAWVAGEQQISWRVPLRRLAVSAAAAVFIISLTHYACDHLVGRWQSGTGGVVVRGLPDLDALPETPYGPFVRRLAAARRKACGIDASALRDHAERTRQLLHEARPTEGAQSPAPANGRSLLPVPRSILRSYS
jgi:hypothetical protein